MGMELPRLQFLNHADINKIKWDERILSSVNGLPYACSWYLDAVTQENWSALVSNDYTWMMPLPIKSKFLIQYLPTPVFIQQLGIFGPGPFPPELAQHFVSHIPDSVKLIEYQFNFMNLVEQSEQFSIRERVNLILPLLKERADCLDSFSENTVRNIRKAEQAKLRYGTSSIRAIINLFQENKQPDLANWNAENNTIVERIYNMSALRNFGRAIGIYNPEGVLLAGAFVCEWKDRSIFLFSGNSEEGKTVGAMPALIYNYILEIPEQIVVFDFEGSDDEGLQRFYRSFGAIESNYVHLKKNQLPKLLRWIKP
jgi:hypothetical protein